MKLKILDFLIIIILLSCLCFFLIFYYNKNIQECTRNPLVYSAKLYESTYPVEAIGTLTLLPFDEDKLPVHITFNSTSFVVEKY